MNQAKSIIQRLDQITVWPYPRRILFIVGAGFFFGFFDIITIGVALPVIQKQFGISELSATWAITASLIGYILGAIIDSRISDLYGRRIALYLSILFFSVGSIFSAASFSLGWLIFWRFITGMGIGAEISGVTTYMSEISPAKMRGKNTAWAIAYGFWGFAIVPFVALVTVPLFSWGWRLLFIIGGLGGVVIFFMRRNMTQSPYWLIFKDRLEQVDQVVTDAENYAKKYHNYIPKKIEMNKVNNDEISISHESFFKGIIQKPYLGRLILFALVWCVYYIGNYGWLTLNTSLFIDFGFDLSNSLLFVALNSLGFIVGSLLAVYSGELIERKYMNIFILCAWCLCLLMIALFGSYSTILIFGFLAAVTIAMAIPLLYTYTAENFPTNIRATSVALTDGFGHLGGAFTGQIIFYFYYLFKPVNYGVEAAFTAMAITGGLTAILLLFGSTMTGKSLSQVEIKTKAENLQING